MKVNDEKNCQYRQRFFNDLYFSFYLKRTCLNRVCYFCTLRLNKVHSDIRLGDFWGDKYKEYDDGVGIVVLNTRKGEDVWDKVNSAFRCEPCSSEEILNTGNLKQFIVPEYYDSIINSLASGERIEVINEKFKINQTKYK